MGVITISREFGSGGRELGRLLATELGYDFYDTKIAMEISKNTALDPSTVEEMLNKGTAYLYEKTRGQTFFNYNPALAQAQADVQIEANRFLRTLAEKRKCVIIGRAADVVLRDFRPFNIFVYASMQHKINRCRQFAKDDEDLSDAALTEKILGIDYRRAEYYRMYSKIPWGEKSAYHLCLNTTEAMVEDFIPVIAEYIRKWIA